MLNTTGSLKTSSFPGSALTVEHHRGEGSGWVITIASPSNPETSLSIVSPSDPLLVDTFIEEMVLLLHDTELADVRAASKNGAVFRDLLHDAELFAVLRALASIRRKLDRNTPQTIALNLPIYDAFLTHGAWETMVSRKTAFTTAMVDFLFPDVPPVMHNPSLAFVATDDGDTYSVGFDTERKHAFRISARRINGQLSSSPRL
jgi:hypothetical protein